MVDAATDSPNGGSGDTLARYMKNSGVESLIEPGAVIIKNTNTPKYTMT
jgi:hypothetical protein